MMLGKKEKLRAKDIETKCERRKRKSNKKLMKMKKNI